DQVKSKLNHHANGVSSVAKSIFGNVIEYALLSTFVHHLSNTRYIVSTHGLSLDQHDVSDASTYHVNVHAGNVVAHV
ncbi:hypothetical protein HOF65_08570, partial [bacterium]|nr:hypothetical protein [bacterium]